LKNSYLYLGLLFVTIQFKCLSQTLSISSSSISCATLGSATVNVSGGVGPFTFTWIPTQQTGSVATGLSPGSYSIITRDAGTSTTFTTPTVFTSPVAFTSTLTTFNPPCFGFTNGVAAVSTSGGSDTQNYFITNGVSNYTTAYASPLSSGAYTYQVIDAITGCSVSGTFSLSQPPALTLNIVANSSTACVNGNITYTGSLSGGTPAYSYSWTNGPVSNLRIVSENSAGTYIYTLVANDANGCAISKTVSSTFIANPNGTITTNASICIGGTLFLSGAGGNTFNWSGPSGFSSSQQSVTIGSLSSNNSGIYSLTVTVPNGCANTTTVNVFVGTPPTITLSAPPRCAGQTLSLTANSSNGIFYFWSGPFGYNSSAQTSFISQAATVNSGIYSLTATSINNCSSTATINVTVFPTPTVIALGSTVCASQTASLITNASIGNTFLWSGPLGFSSTQQNTVIVAPTSSQTGVYTVVVTSTAGCVNTATAGINLLATPGVTVSANSPLCAGGSLSLSATAGLFYSWTGPLGFFDLIQNPTINTVGVGNSGLYNLTVTAANSCTASASLSVTINNTPTVSVFGSTVCAGRTLSLTANSTLGSSYLWLGPANFTANTQNVSVSSSSVSQSGTYTLVVTTLNSCTNTAVTTASVISPPNVNISANNTTLCARGIGGSPNSVIITAAGALTYTIATETYMSNSNPFGPSSSISVAPPNLFSGPTTVTVSGSNGVCTVTLAAGLFVYPNPTNITISNLSPSVCAGQAATLIAGGANTYSWSNSSTNSFVVVSSNNTSSFSVVGTNTNGCSNVTTSILTIVPPPSNILTLSDPRTICVGESATLAAIGATSYTWNGINTGSSTIVSPTITTVYTVSAANSFSCASNFTLKVTVDKCTGIDTPIENVVFLIYPNPAQDYIVIRTENPLFLGTLEIINNLGQVVLSEPYDGDGEKTIHTIDFANGIYYVRIKGQLGMINKAVVISH
jgi:hypothetical protein